MSRELNVRAVRYRPLVAATDLSEEDKAVLAMARRLRRCPEHYETAMRLMAKCLLVAEMQAEREADASMQVVDLAAEGSLFE